METGVILSCSKPSSGGISATEIRKTSEMILIIPDHFQAGFLILKKQLPFRTIHYKSFAVFCQDCLYATSPFLSIGRSFRLEKLEEADHQAGNSPDRKSLPECKPGKPDH